MEIAQLTASDLDAFYTKLMESAEPTVFCARCRLPVFRIGDKNADTVCIDCILDITKEQGA